MTTTDTVRRSLPLLLVLAGALLTNHPLVVAQQAAPAPVPRPAAPLAPRKLIPLDSNGTITYFIADGIERSNYQPGDTQLAIWAFEEWGRAAQTVHFVRSNDEGRSIIRLYWVPPSRTELAVTHSMIANRHPAASVFISPSSPLFRDPFLAKAVELDPRLRDTIVYFLCLHEIGHALGLAHAPDQPDVMQPGGHDEALFPKLRKRVTTRASIPTLEWLSDNDKHRVALLYAP